MRASLISSQALEMALTELQDRLPPESITTSTKPCRSTGNGVHHQSFAARVKTSRKQPTLFDSLSDDSSSAPSAPPGAIV